MKTLLTQFFKKKRKLTIAEQYERMRKGGTFVPGPSWTQNIEEQKQKANPCKIGFLGATKSYSLQKEFNEALQKSKNGKERLECNLEILDLLKDFAEQHPELRFSQILSIFFEKIGFYEEPKDTLEKIKKQL
jgi:hypothetical protein